MLLISLSPLLSFSLSLVPSGLALELGLLLSLVMGVLLCVVFFGSEAGKESELVSEKKGSRSRLKKEKKGDGERTKKRRGKKTAAAQRASLYRQRFELVTWFI